MKEKVARPALALVALAVSCCAPLTDEVFVPIALTPTSPLIVTEGAGIVELPLRLADAPDRPVAVAYRLVGVDAQNHCQAPDFEGAEGRVEWAAGVTEAHARIWVGDDELAEIDERFELWIEPLEPSTTAPLSRVEVVIVDDDRSALLVARELGVLPGAASDQRAALQAVLDRAGELGRAVVVMAPGDYEISSVNLRPGTTLSARSVRWHRPPLSAADIVSLHLTQEGSEQSAPSLVEGLTLDGRRDEQGPYREHEREEAHLVEVTGDPAREGRVRASLESIALASGTGSGLLVGPNSEVTVCGLRASELWRDALTLNGGATVLRARHLDATATQGTGLWLGARVPGFEDSFNIDVEMEDVRVGAGDVEIELSDASRVSLRRLTMTEPPFRLDASGGIVRIEQSVLMLGMQGVRHNHWAVAHDVEIAGSTIVASETASDDSIDEGSHTFAAVALTSQSFALGPASAGAGRLAFTGCRFEVARDIESDDAVYAIGNPDADTSVVVASSELAAGFAGWFAPECAGCVLAP